MKMLFGEVIEILGTEANGKSGQLVITGVSTDSRTLSPGDMFIALKGENFDGSDFIMKAFEKGAVCVVTEKNITGENIINVGSAVRALGELARAHRSKFDIPVIAVTGSTGKTTVKNYLVSVLSQKYKVHSTKENNNNHIGVPMALLELDESHEISVIEMGMSALGEIDYLSYLAVPDIAVITNIGMSHIGILGSKDNILKAKTEVINHMKKEAVLILNGDDEYLDKLKACGGYSVLRFGISRNSDIKAENILGIEGEYYSFDVNGIEYKLNIPGKHNIYNALAAIVVGRLLGISEKMMKEGIFKVKAEKMRLNMYERSGVKIINDAYNANPQSMTAALDILNKHKGRRIAVLGDMLELGLYADSEHNAIGEYAADSTDILIVCGENTKMVKKGAIAAGMKETNISIFKTSDEAGRHLKSILKAKDMILIKGSRGMKMENVLKYIEKGGAE